MRFDIFTIFPGMFQGPFTESILKRAQEQGTISIQIHDIRDWSTDRHRSVDDYPYGGGAGMVMMAPPIIESVESVLGDELARTPVFVMSPAGEPLTQALAGEIAQHDRVVIVCGRYEGIDERVHTLLDTHEISIGDYVLTGGELPAAVLVDVVSRLIPDVIDPESIADESHGNWLLEYPHYTRPPEYRGLTVPAILLSGHHANIAEWRHQQALCRTHRRRPDLLAKRALSPRDRKLLEGCLPEER